MIQAELRRVILGPKEPLERSVMQVNICCDGKAEKVLDKIKEALVMILSTESLCEDEHSFVQDSTYELMESWLDYYILQHIDEECLKEGKKRIRYFGEDRDWFWWSSRVVDENNICVYLLLEGFPVSGFDDFKWLLKCCGALEVEQGDVIQPNDVKM